MSIENLVEKWQPVLEHEDLDKIDSSHKRSVTAQLLENTKKALEEGDAWSVNSLLAETPTNAAGTGGFSGSADAGGPVAGYDPVLINLVRRSMPNLIAYDVAGVQPMTGPTGLIFAMRSRYSDQANTEAFYNEAEVSVTAKSRALKAEYTTELAQDLKAVHGLDAETELANILTSEVLAEINREVVRTIYTTAKAGSQSGVTTAGTFDLDVDANGRWSVEKFKGLMFQIEREANVIAKQTRRGKGNMIICSSDVASALQMAGVLDYTPALNSNNGLSVDDTGNTFAGVLNGRFRVYIDPYAANNYMVVGYKGSSAFDAGLFYCPYVPLQMVRAVGENSFQPKIGFKTRYGMVANPFAEGANQGLGALTADTNVYYRRTRISNIL